MSDEQIQNRLSEPVRKRISAALQNACGKTGSFPVKAITPKLLTPLGINWRDYAAAGEKLGEWLDRTYPEFVRSEDGATIFPREVPAQGIPRQRVTNEVRGVITKVLNEALGTDQSVLLSDLGSRLLAAGIDRHAYTGEGLADWITGMFPGLRKSDDGLRLCREAANPYGPVSAAPGPTYPAAERTLSMIDLDEDIRQMHTVALMGWWNNNVRTLKRLTGCTGSDTRIWSGIIAQKMSDIFLGHGSYLYEEMEDGAYRLAFYAGMDTPEGRPIYCVLTRNQLHQNGKYQPMILEAFSWPGEPENAELGSWLKKHLDTRTSRQAEMSRTDIVRLEELCVRLEELRQRLILLVRSVLQALEEGAEIPASEELDLKAYRSTWQTVRGLCEAMEVPQELTSPKEIISWCAEQNQFTICLKQIEQSFGQMQEDLARILSQHQINGKDLGEDRSELHQACESYGSEVHAEDVRKIFLPYRQLLEVMDPMTFSQDMMKLMRVTSLLDQHFGFATMQVFGWKVKNPDQYQLLQQDLAALDSLVEALEALSHPQISADQEPKTFPSAQEMLDALGDGRVSALWSAGGGRNQLETLILEDRLPEALSLAGDSRAMADAGYPEEYRQRIVLRLSDGQNLPEGHTIYNAGRRMIRIMGDENKTAERYLLMGLFVEPEECGTELLRIYRQTNQPEKFLRLWPLLGSVAQYDVENDIYYIQQLRGASPEQIRGYLDSHVFLYYLPECAEAIAAVCPEIELPEWVRKKEEASLNPLEQALVADQASRILELLDNRDALAEMGYGSEQITQISQAAISDQCPAGTAPYQTGTRIYLYQGNLHGLAERYLWQGLAREQGAAKSDRLIRLLAEEQRWAECIRLYNCYASESGTGADSRQAYLLALLHADPIRAQQFIRGSLQDFLSLVYQNPDAAKTIDGYQDSANDAFREFYRSACQLTGLLEEDYPRSVILHNRSLRDMVTQPAMLSELGMEDRQIECAKTLYQSGSYPQGTDSVSVARRAYAFLGTYHGIAEKLARFALPAEDALELLWTIYSATTDIQEQHILLQNYPALRQTHPDEYGQYLFDTAQYDRFLDWVPLENATQAQRLRQAIAKLALDPQTEIKLPGLEEPVSKEQIADLIRLGGILVRLDRLEDVEGILFPNFDILLQGCSPQELERMMTGDGSLTQDGAAWLQTSALEKNLIPVALYYYNTMQVGDLSQQADAYYAEILDPGEDGAIQSQLSRMERLAKLYPGRYQELNDRIYLLKVCDLLENEPASKETPGKIARMLDGCTLDVDGIRRLIEGVRNSAYADSAVVVQSITKLTDREDLRIDGLVYLHQVAVALSGKSVLEEALYTNLCQRYLDVLNRGSFPEALGTEAETLCRRLIRSDRKLYQAVLCLYRIEVLLNQRLRAEYVLRYLVTQPANALGSKLYVIVEAAAEDCWKGKVPGVLSMFREVLDQDTPEDILSYCQFCSIFAEASDEDLYLMHYQIQNLRQQKLGDGGNLYEYSQCTDVDGESLVKVLCSAPDKADYWWACTALPALTPGARGKLLYNCGVKNPNMWQECVRYCVEFELNEMLLRSLRKWSGIPSPGPRNCRTYLADALAEDPNFFDRWTEPENARVLLELLELLCADLSGDLVNLPNTVAHTALNAISAVASGLRSDRAMEILEQYLSEALLTNYSEVGVATVLRLLLAGRHGYAQHLLDGLGQSGSPIACRFLVDRLNAMDRDQLAQWAGEPESRLLMELLLPDGNRPTAKDIQAFTLNMIQKKRIREGTNVLNILLDIFPGDYACCDALFILCKCGLEDPIPMLHRSLCGLISSSANGYSYYRRDFVWNAKLLAGVNAIIKARHLENSVQQISSDYHFHQPAGNYCLLKKPETTVDVVNAINIIQRNLTSDLENLRADVLDRKCQEILCWVTGDWTVFLRDAWQRRNGETDVSEIRDALGMEYDKTHSGLESMGFCRSLLRVMEELNESQWMPFLHWVRLALLDSGGKQDPEPWELRGKLRHVYLAMDLVKHGVVKKAGDMPLCVPYEEYSLLPLIYGEKIESCIGSDPELMYNRLWLMGAVVDYHVLIQYQYSNPAQMAFRKGDDVTAAVFYEVMLRLLSRGLYHSASMSRSQFHSFNAQYEAYARISRLMLGDSEITAKVSSAGFNAWSCINMTVALLCTSRGNQAARMAAHFGRTNTKLSLALIRGINPNVSDSEKLNTLRNFPEGVGKAYLAYMMSLGSGKGEEFHSYFFSDKKVSWEVKKLSRSLAEQFSPKYFTKHSKTGSYIPCRTLITTFHQINFASYDQLPVLERELIPASDTDSSKPQLPSQEAAFPAFASGLTPLEQADDLETLEEEHRRLPHLKRYYRERLQLSEQIYRMTLASGRTPAQMLPGLINFGLDYYDYHMDLNSPEELSLAYRAVAELVLYVDCVKNGISDSERPKLAGAVKTLETAVENTILYNLLDKGHLSIHSMIDQFAQDRKAFELMRKMVQLDELRKESVNTIYSALDLLVERYCTNADNDVLLREGLIKAQSLIDSIIYGAWQPLKNRLHSLIQNEVNAMDRRPILSMRILNADQNPEDDYLYGEISNDGLETALDITVQVTYEDSSSDRYRLSALAPKECNAFKIRYSAPENAESLQFALNWSYVFGGQTYNLPAEKKAIPICQVPEPTFPVGQYETQTITDFYEDSEGNIVNPNFFGREKETAELRNLFRSGRFPGYNNAIVYGIRRAGKTTLLNYVKKYVSVHCDDAIIIKVDCLNNANSRLVQSLFIDRVLNAIQGDYPQFKRTEGWNQLCADWKLPSDSTVDRDPEDLELFYQELKQVTGKGLILMLDEVDNFFTAVEQQTSLDSHLFQVLSNMLCNPSSQEVIHFIFCGSKYLLRYRTGDGGLSQLFQRFGSNIIEVGLISKSEMRKMILKPYEDYPEVRITEEAINWIWEYTQGLVWHVKLLANMVLQHVREDGRSIVYPVDVKSRIRDIVQKEYCEQFFDGINEKEKDKQERLVVDALQSMASSRNTYVPKSTLLQILTSEALPVGYRMTVDQIENAMDNLIKLRLVVYSEPDKGYRFPVDLYRLYFRSQREYPFIFKKVAAAEPSFSRI